MAGDTACPTRAGITTLNDFLKMYKLQSRLKAGCRQNCLPHQHYPERLPQNVQTPEPAESRLQAELPAPPTLP